MKIFLLNALYYPDVVGGAERVVQSLAESLVIAGHEVIVAALGGTGASDDYAGAGVRVRRLPLRNLYWPFQGSSANGASKAVWHLLDSYNPLMAKAVGTLLDDEKPDVVHTHNLAGFSSAVWHGAKVRRLPLVHTLHDQYLLCPRSSMFRNGHPCVRQCIDCRAFSFARKQATRNVDVVIGVSSFILDLHQRHGSFLEARRKVVYNAYEHPQPEAADNCDASRRLRFGFLGRLSPVKGVEQLIDAFLTLPPGRAELLIAGRGDAAYEERLKARTADNTEVRWLGFVNPELLLNDIDILVVPSLWQEPAALVILEAFAFGRPVIGSQRGGTPELITRDTGWVYDPDEPGALQRRLQRCLDARDTLTVMGTHVRERARHFTVDAMVKGYVEAYECALGEAAS